jgi:hypothetical protein
MGHAARSSRRESHAAASGGAAWRPHVKSGVLLLVAALAVDMLRRAGFDAGRATAALTASTGLQLGTTAALPLLALPVIVGGASVNRGLASAASLGIAVLLLLLAAGTAASPQTCSRWCRLRPVAWALWRRGWSARSSPPVSRDHRRGRDAAVPASRALSGRRACWSSATEPAGRGPFAEGTGAGPAGEQGLQLAQQLPQRQADAAGFGRRSRSRVRKPWATATRVTW